LRRKRKEGNKKDFWCFLEFYFRILHEFHRKLMINFCCEFFFKIFLCLIRGNSSKNINPVLYISYRRMSLVKGSLWPSIQETFCHKNMFYEHEDGSYTEIYVCGAIYNKEKRKGWHLKRVLGHKCKDLHTHT
jgi:hypothetical protein